MDRFKTTSAARLRCFEQRTAPNLKLPLLYVDASRLLLRLCSRDVFHLLAGLIDVVDLVLRERQLPI